MLASEAPDKRQLDDYWDRAQDLQREARELRSEIKKISECKGAESGAEQSSQSAASNSRLRPPIAHLGDHFGDHFASCISATDRFSSIK
jgi:hypothetical protein